MTVAVGEKQIGETPNQAGRSVRWSQTSELAPFIHKLSATATLREMERNAIMALPIEVRSYQARELICQQDSRLEACCVVLDGLVSRAKYLGDGQRLLLTFHRAGDVPDLQMLHLRHRDHALVAIEPARVGFINNKSLHDLVVRFPAVGSMLWRESEVDALFLRERLTIIGWRTAHERIAHLICELYLKVGSGDARGEREFRFPLTQIEVADAVGLTPVHVNRVMRALRGDGLIAKAGRNLKIVDLAALKKAAGFQADLLLNRTRASAGSFTDVS